MMPFMLGVYFFVCFALLFLHPLFYWEKELMPFVLGVHYFLSFVMAVHYFLLYFLFIFVLYFNNEVLFHEDLFLFSCALFVVFVNKQAWYVLYV